MPKMSISLTERLLQSVFFQAINLLKMFSADQNVYMI